MNAVVILLSVSSILSFATTFLLIFSGLPVPKNAELTSLLASVACFGTAAVIMFASRNGKPGHDEAVAEELSSNTVPYNVQSMLIGIRKKLTEESESIREILEYPLFGKLLTAKTAEDLADAVTEAHRRIVSAENVLSALSDHVLTDSLILLPLADAIIKAVPEKTEEAAMTVLEKFMVVREASSNAAISARTLREQLEEKNEQSLSYAADLSRSAVRKERDVIKELAAATKENRTELQRMSEEIASGLDLLKNIEEITERSKLIAFNMSIEAARIGEKGLGFKVIITELHKLNEQTFDFSKKVAELLNRFRDHTTTLVTSMEAKSVAVVREVEHGMDTAESAVEKLIDASARTEEFTKQIAGMSESIDRDLDGVLESMQFQDITRQMIEGSMAILEDLQKTLDDCLARNEIYIDEKRKQDRFTTIKNRLVSNAKTKGEKDALMEVQV